MTLNLRDNLNRVLSANEAFAQENTNLRSKLAAAEAGIARVKECHEETAEKLHTYIKLHAAAEAELTSANAQMRELGRQLAEAGEARIAAEASVARLREALEPFARYAAVLAEGSVNYLPPRCPVHASPQSDPDCATIRVVDLHRAAATFSQSPSDYRERVRIEHDGFEGDVIGHYQTREGKRGVVLQQHGTRVVHVYGTKWIRALGDSNANE